MLSNPASADSHLPNRYHCDYNGHGYHRCDGGYPNEHNPGQDNYRPPSNFIRNGQSAWSHDPQHRGGVAYPAPHVAERVGAPAARVPRAPVGPAMTPRPEVRQPAPQVRPASRPDRDHTVFGGSSSGGNRARVESDRGHASLGNRSVPRPAPAPQAHPAPRPAQERPGERR